MIAHAQKPDFVFRRNRRVHLNRQGLQFTRLLASRGVRISGSNAGCTMFRGSVKSTGYPPRQFPPSLPLPCVTVCHHISTGLCRCSVRVLIPAMRLLLICDRTLRPLKGVPWIVLSSLLSICYVASIKRLRFVDIGQRILWRGMQQLIEIWKPRTRILS